MYVMYVVSIVVSSSSKNCSSVQSVCPSSLLFLIAICSLTVFFSLFFLINKLWDHCNWLTAVVVSQPNLLVSTYTYSFIFLYHVIGEANKIK